MISRIDHVSIAVNDYERAWHFFVNVLGAVPGLDIEDKQMKYYWRIFSLGDLSRMELLKMTDEGSFLENFLADKTGGVHHITLETPDILQFIQRLKDHNIPYFGYREVSETYKELFIHPKDAFGVLIQVCELIPDDYVSKKVKLTPGERWSIEKSDTGCELAMAHPGGGKVNFQLNRDEVKNLIKALEDSL